MDVTKDDGIRELAKFNQRTLRRQVGHTSACLCIEYYSLSSHPADFDAGEAVMFVIEQEKRSRRYIVEKLQNREFPRAAVEEHPVT